MDGLSGTAVVASTEVPTLGDTELDLTSVSLNTDDVDLVPVGARFYFDSAPTVVYTVTARTPASSSPTTNITFTPALPASFLAGTAAVKSTETPEEGNTDLDIETVALNTTDTGLVPIGARFSFAVTPTVFYTVTERTPASTGPTTNIVFTPALPASPPAASEVITFKPSVAEMGVTFQAQKLEIKIGEGNASWTEAKDYSYDLDRGNLDTVRELDQQPCEVSLDFMYEYVKTGTGEDIAPVDAIKGIGGAVEWVNAATDPCTPYAVDMLIEQVAQCGSTEDTHYLFPEFRYDSLDFNISDATISVSGRINSTEPTITRV
jgi:hypothetical protein